MEENQNSWLTRAKFSPSVYQESRLLRSLRGSSSVGTNQDIQWSFRPHVQVPSSFNKSEASSTNDCQNHIKRLRSVDSVRKTETNLSSVKIVRQLSKSLPEEIEEARSDAKSFSSLPRRKELIRKIIRSMFPRDFHGHSSDTSLLTPNSASLQTTPSTNVSDKPKIPKESSWAKYFDHSGRRVTALETVENWTVDLSKLFIGNKFASGAHSKLYHAIYKGEPVAVKMIKQPDNDENGSISAQLEKEFHTEVTMLSSLHHQSIIKLVAACRKPPVFFIIIEYLSGGSLRSFLHKVDHKSVSLKQLSRLALEIARGMEFIHSQGVIHRDLKPENIIFDENGHLKIVDFGIACEEAFCISLTEDPGTYRWMAPEMIKHKHYGRKVDVYSFGLVLWEMLTGRIPYDEMTPIQAAFAVVDKNLRPIIPSDCPSTLRDLIEQCWALNPDKRPEFSDIVNVLEQFDSSLDTEFDVAPSI